MNTKTTLSDKLKCGTGCPMQNIDLLRTVLDSQCDGIPNLVLVKRPSSALMGKMQIETQKNYLVRDLIEDRQHIP